MVRSLEIHSTLLSVLVRIGVLRMLQVVLFKNESVKPVLHFCHQSNGHTSHSSSALASAIISWNNSCSVFHKKEEVKGLFHWNHLTFPCEIHPRNGETYYAEITLNIVFKNQAANYNEWTNPVLYFTEFCYGDQFYYCLQPTSKSNPIFRATLNCKPK